jgi:uncharacterized protein YeaO (DUF488 family)
MSPIITATLSAAKHIQCDERWLITRVEAKIDGILWVSDLAPSQRLFRKYFDEWKGTPVEDYWPQYVEMFQEELKQESKLIALRHLWHLSTQGVSVALFCYCQSPEHCHRSLVGDFMRSHGVTVMEYVPRQDVLFDDREKGTDLFFHDIK